MDEENQMLNNIKEQELEELSDNINYDKINELRNRLHLFTETYKKSYENICKIDDIKENIYPYLLIKNELNYTKIEDLKNKLDTFLLAHKDCRKIFYRYDKILKISTLIFTCATSYLLGTESEYNNLEMYFAFASAVTSGLNNYFNNETIAEKHTGIIIQYTELINNIDKLLDNLKSQEEIDNYFNEYHDMYTKINNKTVEVGIFEYIRRKYKII